MARNYGDWLSVAARQKAKLDQAIYDRNAKDVLYYRGKYLAALKQAQKLNPSGLVPASLTGAYRDFPIDYVVHEELVNHQNQIQANLNANKMDAINGKPRITKEIGLKIRRLATHVSQYRQAQNSDEKREMKKEIAKDSAGLTGTAIKTPIMAAAKVTSKIGPLTIKIVALPLKVLSSLLSVTIDVVNGKTSDPSVYSNTWVDQLSDGLGNLVKNVSNSVYQNVGRI